MKKLRVGDLRSFMDKNFLSAEAIAEQVPLSNMTIRRLLKLSDSKVISEKYQPHLSQLMNQKAIDQTMDAQSLLQKLSSVNNGDMIDQLILDAEDQNPLKVKKDLEKKLKEEASWSQTILDYVKTLNKVAFGKSHPKAKLIAIGALLYFVNPFDLIPDSIPVIGYLDDIGVMALAIHQINKIIAEENAKSGTTVQR